MAVPQDLEKDGDFGYDFSPEEEHLLLQLGSPDHPSHASLPPHAEPSSSHGPTRSLTKIVNNGAGIDFVPGKTESVLGQDASHELDLARPADLPGRAAVDGTLVPAQGPGAPALPSLGSIAEDIQYPNLSRALADIQSDQPASELSVEASTSGATTEVDQRSPLERFRSYPRKPLSVSDLTSGAWCELQYWYTLTRLPGGRKTRTPAMRQGTVVHQKLEDEVHTTVRVEVMSKEDGFGLRLWNLVQGLRTLRDTGLTRELEVWGMVDGNLVNGVIDSVSYEHPNPEFEEQLSSQESHQDRRQSSLTDFFPQKQPKEAVKTFPKIYLTDVKTRGSLKSVSKVLLRPAKIQLLLYHRILSDIAAGRLDFLRVFERYGLKPDEPFSDLFIAQVGGLHDEIFVDAPTSSDEQANHQQGNDATRSGEPYRSQSTEEPDLLKYRSLRELLPLIQEELALTFPLGEQSLGNMLRVQYVYREDGRELDLHDFPVSKQALDAYMEQYMSWWRGERQARGVDIEEAFKCRTCEFAADCSWRAKMDEERVAQARLKMSRRKRHGTT